MAVILMYPCLSNMSEGWKDGSHGKMSERADGRFYAKQPPARLSNRLSCLILLFIQ
jgi:hypothetical protein